MRKVWVVTPAAVALCVAVGSAATPPQRCERGKNDAAGKYALCRQKAEGKHALTGDDAARTTALQKCLGKYEQVWSRLEAKAAKQGTSCPSTGDANAIQGAIDLNTSNVATALGGGALSDCPAALATCQGDLSTCNGSLGSCSGSLTTCTGDLSTCNTSLGTAQAGLTMCTSDLTTCNTNLSTTQANLTTCSGSLATCNADLTTCNGDLGTCNTNLSTAQTNLTTCSGNLSTCQSDLATCQATPQAQPLKTGQTTCADATGTVIPCAGTGQDGELQKGLARAYVGNGDGTVTDTKTGLMWEKLSDDGTIHDWDDTYTFDNAVAVKIAALNAGGGFAGHTDWRVPSLIELESLPTYGGAHPAVSAEFNNGCAPACTVLTCSCTRPTAYWTSTSYQAVVPFSQGWWVAFDDGSNGLSGKTFSHAVRAVRGGS